MQLNDRKIRYLSMGQCCISGYLTIVVSECAFGRLKRFLQTLAKLYAAVFADNCLWVLFQYNVVEFLRINVDIVH